jgi:hypothetical protein
MPQAMNILSQGAHEGDVAIARELRSVAPPRVACQVGLLGRPRFLVDFAPDSLPKLLFQESRVLIEFRSCEPRPEQFCKTGQKLEPGVVRIKLSAWQDQVDPLAGLNPNRRVRFAFGFLTADEISRI